MFSVVAVVVVFLFVFFLVVFFFLLMLFLFFCSTNAAACFSHRCRLSVLLDEGVTEREGEHFVEWVAYLPQRLIHWHRGIEASFALIDVSHQPSCVSMRVSNGMDI